MSTHNICFCGVALLVSTHNICFCGVALLMSTKTCFCEEIRKKIRKKISMSFLSCAIVDHFLYVIFTPNPYYMGAASVNNKLCLTCCSCKKAMIYILVL